MSVETASQTAANLAKAPGVFRAAVNLAGRNWSAGSLTFILPDGETVRLQGDAPGPDARLFVRDYRFIRRALLSGDIGFAEGYMAGEWDTPDLAALLGVFAVNFDVLRGLTRGNVLSRAFHAVNHALRRNSRRGSKRNIHAHYDLGNDFYARWLDPTMTYSSAIFAAPDQPLAEAQRNKYATLARSIGLAEGHKVLEIGCGWGGFAEYAAKEVGARVTGVTISQAQYDFARKRLFDQGLADKADIRLIDYRDIQGRFDRVASIEMFEAVGERYWPAYFSKIREVLVPGGKAGLQIITIRDRDFDNYRRRADFIQKYIFPGGMLPSEQRLREESARAGLGWEGVSRFGQNYADTLQRWLRNFDAAWDGIAPLCFDERFRRLWRFYLAYCEAGFRTGRTDVVQLALSRD
jgi:cyclopropane-fatty-acyl-phospholipid synthase